MKKYLLSIVVVIVTLTSCNIDDDVPSFYLEVLPIESVEMPEQFIYGEIHEIFIDYIRPSSCYVFNDFLYQINEQERTVGIINTVYTDNACEENAETVTVSFQFNVTSFETYVFKFYQGEDEDGIDEYLIMEVPVVE
tara:strand:- start:529 stop:939 length:411 start_codon:yes stop_codon:yes gene_type:complete